MTEREKSPSKSTDRAILTKDTSWEFFFFVNTASGSGEGASLLTKDLDGSKMMIAQDNENVDVREDILVRVNMCSLRDSLRMAETLHRLKKRLSEEKKVRVVACGGDGTIVWVISEFKKQNLNSMEIPLVILPLGTGNDFALSLGWGKGQSGLTSNNYQRLKYLMTDWINGDQADFDLWTMQAEAQEYGKFQKVEHNENVQLEGKNITKDFCCYFSFGIDSKIGYSFDKHRTSFRTTNFIMYGLLGFVKSMTKTKTLGELVEEINIITKVPSNKEETDKIEVEDSEQVHSTLKTCIFSASAENQSQLKTNQNLLALNINSYIGGSKDIWGKASPSKEASSGAYTHHSENDGKLEIVSFSSAMSLAMEKTFHGYARKVTQTEGPIEIIFKKYDKRLKHRTYFEVDGEFTRLTHPKRILLKPSNLAGKSSIRVIKKYEKQPKKSYCC